MGGMVLRKLSKLPSYVRWTDGFANDPTTATNGPVPDWLDYGGSPGAGSSTAAQYSGDILSNQLASAGNPPVNASGTVSVNLYKNPLQTDDFDIRALTFGTQTGYGAYVVGSATKDQGTYIALGFTRGTATPTLLKVVNGVSNGTLPATASSVSIPVSTSTVNTWIRFRRTGNFYEGFVNGTRVLTWTDTTAQIAMGPGFRYAGLRSTSLRSASGGAVTRGLMWDKFTARDSLATQSPGHVYNSASLQPSAANTYGTPLWVRNPAVPETFLTTNTLGIITEITGNIIVRIKIGVTTIVSGQVLTARITKNTATTITTLSTAAGTNNQTLVSNPIAVTAGDAITVAVMSSVGTNAANRTFPAGLGVNEFTIEAA